ncbi:bifunctional metallophosphatase/5'-nucleotidase [Staphylococcus massiliensis]|uniref:23-cyclic-nucleotide 2-phosphodiesterase n=1 Tax=Staphylococcus massiliensis S46 TaxID=1229783 RepID=K9AMN2_9STAP|nr:bifunctional UDP-sugar hydrolase/5'-nucleotidase [Staphylococcus massiliensis]EKU48574.1 23-cyclic-nucleotide 2-phosphodiesterase [Staphylococcus massiliensis S46]POA00626.1 bifunctional metallophosphatase/5'-nucleotidase [Staphylococcus massiliensis CCUG 55927]
MKEIVILSVSDIHGYIFPTNYQHKGQELSKGLLKIQTLIEKERQANTNTLLIENGDFIQGSPFCFYLNSELQSSEMLTKVYNQIGFDVGVIGNHEFNFGLPYLHDTLDRLNYPVLSANITTDGKPFTGHDVVYKEIDGVTVAIIGVTTPYIPNWEKPEIIAGLEFETTVSYLKAHIQSVRDKADIVVVSYHGGFERDLETGNETEQQTGENEGYQILQEVDGIDVLITGHQHREIATVKEGVSIVQPGSKGDFLGKIVLQYDAQQHTIKHQTTDLIPVTEETVSQEAPQAVRDTQDKLEAWLDAPLVHLNEDMLVKDDFKARIKPHPIVNLLNHAQMSLAGVDISCTPLFPSARGFSKTVTMRDIIDNYPFPNTFNVLEVTGAELKAALEKTATYFDVEDGDITVNQAFLEPKPQHFNYDMYSGIDYTIHASNEAGARVHDVTFKGEPVTDAQTYQVVMNNYRAVGGGDYAMFDESKIVKDIPVEGAEMLIQYLKHQGSNDIPNLTTFKVTL